MRITTKTGDLGITDLKDKRVSKNDIYIECIGEIDTFMAKCILNCAKFKTYSIEFKCIVEQCTVICSYLAGYITDNDLNIDIVFIEELINKFEDNQSMFDFVYPYDNEQAASYNELRTVTRATERKCVELYQKNGINSSVMTYFNRLSDLFYLLTIIHK